MTLCFVSIGSNIERQASLASGLSMLEGHFGKLQLSSIYESEAVGFTGDAFYNLVAGFDTDKEIETVLQVLREIEIANGRPVDSKKFSSRKLDLDLILYGDHVIDDGAIRLPRSDIETYAFVLEPLSEIAPDLTHPVLNKSYSELWQLMPKEGLQQRKMPFAFNDVITSKNMAKACLS